MLNRDTVLEVLRKQGPSLPVQIKKAIGIGDTFMIGAILTELKEAGKLLVSNTKRGGSPFYYLPEHAPRLADFITDLDEKERRAAFLLKEKKILRDKQQDPLMRVCLRQIKDFSMPLEVRLPEGAEIYWKWYLISNAEAETLIKQDLGVLPAETPLPPPLVPAPTPAVVAEQAPIPASIPEKQVITQETKQKTKAPKKELVMEQEMPQEKALQSAHDDAFLTQIMDYFAEKKIIISKQEIIRKNNEMDFELTVPSVVGSIDYYCKAKNKKKNSDGDLSSAYLKGQMRKLPVLYITTGEITKKAKEMLGHEFKGMVFVQLT
jgi:hypothetical protein